MRTREEIEAKVAEIEEAEGDKGHSAQNERFLDALESALEYVDSQTLEYGWYATATGWANGDIENLRIETESEDPGELEQL